MAHNHDINSGRLLPHDTELEGSYGKPIPQPTMTKGEIVAFGESAGSTSKAMPLEPKRNICFDDSIDDQRGNLPKGTH